MIFLQHVSIDPWWASAIVWGASGGTLYYASRWLFDRYHLNRAAKTAIIAIAWLTAILATVNFEMNASEQLFPTDRFGRRTIVVPGVGSAAFTKAAALGYRLSLPTIMTQVVSHDHDPGSRGRIDS
jgi:hypothetical protein